MDELIARANEWAAALGVDGPLRSTLGRVSKEAGDWLGWAERITLAQLALTVVLAAGIYWWRHRAHRPHWRGALAWIFPAKVYRTRSAGVDVKIYLLKVLVPFGVVVSAVTITAVAALVASGLRDVFGAPAEPLQGGPLQIALLGFLLLLAFDLGTYIAHRLGHEVPILWAFHRVHHSAEALNPLTLKRVHPVSSIFSKLIDAPLIGSLKGLVIYFWAPDVGVAAAAATSLGFGVFATIAGNLRHSHIWLSFGPRVERLFVSPALHQIHHSKAVHHWDRNYGEVLAIWDWMFGTLYLPKGHEQIEFGLSEGDPHPTLRAALIEPFHYSWARLRELLRGEGRFIVHHRHLANAPAE